MLLPGDIKEKATLLAVPALFTMPSIYSKTGLLLISSWLPYSIALHYFSPHAIMI